MNIVPLPDFKVRIRCSNAEKTAFEKNICPSSFNEDWASFMDCDHDVTKKSISKECQKCWSEYVIWEVYDA